MANVTMASPAVWRAGDAVFVALQRLWRELSTYDKAGKRTGRRSRSGVDPTPAIETAWCAAVPGNRGFRRSSPPRTGPQIRSCSSSAPKPTTGSTPFVATRANSSLRPPEHMRGFRRYETIIAAGDRLYAASGGQAYAFNCRWSPDSIARSSRKRISPSLLVSEITKRTRPWLEVSA